MPNGVVMDRWIDTSKITGIARDNLLIELNPYY